MKIKCTRFSLILFLIAGAAFIAMAVPAQATFVVDTDPGGLKFYICDAYKNVTTFYGSVGVNSNTQHDVLTTTGQTVDTEYVNTGSGYATIKPVKDGELTYLTFYPQTDRKYGDFSFRGQLSGTGSNAVEIKVYDQNNILYDFSILTDKDQNGDFSRIGVLSTDGGWIKSVAIMTTGEQSFKEVKQIDFSSATAVPVPPSVWLLGSGLVGLVGLRRRFFRK